MPRISSEEAGSRGHDAHSWDALLVAERLHGVELGGLHGGRMPKRMPTAARSPRPGEGPEWQGDREAENLFAAEPARAQARCRAAPPSRHRTIASMRNCPRMSGGRAPHRHAEADFAGALGDRDRHQAMIPMPPTINAIEEMTNSASTTACVNCRNNPTMKSAVTVSKSFSSPSLSRWRALISRLDLVAQVVHAHALGRRDDDGERPEGGRGTGASGSASRTSSRG